MLKSGVLEQAEPSASFLSTFFLVPKPDGSYRPILNLKQLNRFVKTKPFRLFSHFRVPTFLQHQDWMAKLDLSQAYFHVPIARRHRRYLRLNYPINSNQHQLLQMTCLPFGLSSAPRTFASITNWVAEFLRNRGIRCVVYLDDFLLASQSMQQLQEDISLTIKIMQLLGWTINFEKSVLTPTQCLEFLGITWDTKLNAMSLSEKKCLTLRNALQQQLLKRKWSLKQYQILMGRLNFATYVTRRGRLHCRTLQYFSRQLSKDHPYRQVSIPLPVQSEMEWWLQAVGQSVPIHTNVVLTHLLTTDASDIGWGAQLGDISIGGTWTKRQLTWHANRKEMFAVHAAISHEQKLLQNSQVLLQTDNRTVVSYINKEGGSKSKKLLEQTLQLLALLDKFNIHLQAQYFPGRFNVEVDALSRQRTCPEWHLTTAATSKIFRMWGTPEIDLFASSTAHVTPKYVSVNIQDKQAQHHNAFCHQWHYKLAWLFPPPNLIPRVLNHLNQASGLYILIAPKWNKVSSPHSSRHENRHTPSTDSRLALGGMVDFGWQDMLTEWTDKEQKLLISSWRGSTINTYKPAWNRWKKWCESNSVNYKYPHPEQVARYLAHLHCDIGLAYRTILVHKSVISTFTHLTSKVDLSSNFFIKHMLKAISMARTRPVKPPIWNPKFLMQYISKYNPNENNLYEVSRHTATLLLLASSRRVHDLTLLHIDNNSLIDDQSSIILWPAFGSKTDSINHRQSGWRLKEHPDKNLNIIFWIRQLLKISKNRRKAINHLFITARGDAKPASRTVIAGWVKSLLREAGIEATPGSVRSAVSSLNWLENFSLDKILETGNWKTVHTFQNYYKKELKEIDINNSVSLSNYFDAIN
ncbi:unnamed protein product [Parnassius mnemosyne]|uniref:Reverse transcriptase domain-containing protein n=1 Tax=Parnassius mnemosyne TaxID=213953 RepID=A0AAV1LUS9_9NEOP